ncbi:N-acetylmuramoyl-L-alanine amidase [Serinicoccus hydrothermalis]|uniref:N-acetylmuramoyl-L-alanine amidase n=1 Tax=Serinicoccus hydrothermalis TaxID=1758689 RepID=A0A1B1NCM3_9MICO|nr:cell wall-binding repeat-containing protein [Serinicoccus hydrothermalis]ANS79182.1 N-acetylmuramoyl-L-alanine amidase [Serinicoccus hydrothermalis]
MSSAWPGGRPRRTLSAIAVLSLTGAVLAPLSAAADDDALVAPGSPAPESKIQTVQGSGTQVVPGAYFVQLAGPSTVLGGSMDSIESQRDRFLADVADAGVELEVRSEFGSLWNGLSVSAEEDSLPQLASSDAVEAIFPVGVVDAPEEPEGTQVDPELFTAISMTGADIVQSELGYDGTGVKVGIIDTGIDYDHPDFGGNGSPDSTTFPTERVAFGYDFVGDDYNADPSAGEAYQPKPFPDEDPDDCQGHGTHVAGITGASGEVTGVAPGVTLGAYRVFGCEGSTDSDIMLHAMEQTLADDMDVVNLSIGSAFSAWKEYPTAQATDALAREGVIVVASIGNSGANGLHSVGAPGVGEDTIGVGSVDNTFYDAIVFVDEEGNDVPFSVGSPAPVPPTSGEDTLVAVHEPGTTEAQACGADPFTAEEQAVIEGNWVLIQRGTCSFYEKARNGQAAGAAGVMLYNNVAGTINPSVAGDPPIEVPVVMVGQADGERLAADALATDGHTVTWTGEEASVPNPNGGLISSFSSIGTMADTTFKPDLTAPGGLIYSTYPLETQPYATLSGTSMAAPHVAGAAALMLEADPDLGVEEAKLRLQNSSIQLPFNGAPDVGLEIVHRQGTGMIQIDDSILAQTTIEPGLVQLGQQLSGESSTQSVTVTNTSDTEQVYAVEHIPAVATSGTANVFGYYLAPAEVEVASSVTVPAGGSVEVPMTITSPAVEGEMGPIFGGYVTFTSGEGEEADTYTVAYGGQAADLQETEVLADQIDADGNVTQEMPAMGVVAECGLFLGYECVEEGGTYSYVDEGYVYSMEQDDAPQVLVHFEHQARRMEWEVFAAADDGSKGESVGTVAELDYLARSATRNGFSAYPWDGMMLDENGAKVRVPDGDYILELTVTKAKAWNDDREAQTETWDSPVFGIAFEGSDYGNEDRASVERTLGQDRYSTASELAVEAFPQGAETVYVASGQAFPDALAGGALAGSVEAPVLLTQPDALPDATRMALQQLGPDSIVVLGGDGAVDDDVVTALGEYAETERLAGSNRYETAVQVSQSHAENADVVFLASGRDYPDALAAAAAAGMEDASVLLTRPDLLPGATSEELARLSPETVYVIGGDAAVSDDVAGAAGASAGEVVRLGGTNRYGTAAAVAGEFFPTPGPGAFLATGTEFPDALAAAPVAAMNNMAVLLTKPEMLPADTVEAMTQMRAQLVHIVGGYGAVSLEVQETLEAVVYP